MIRILTAAALLVVTTAGSLPAQGVKFPDTPQGRLAAGFIAAVNAPDEGALGRFQEANFSEAALKRRPTQVRLAQNRQIREDAGTLTPVEVRGSGNQLVVIVTGSNTPPGMRLTVTFTFTSGDAPKIDQLQIAG
jgi:hypothetical protein